MRILAVIGFILFLNNVSFSQNQKDKFSFEFGYGINGYNMGTLNEYYIDSFALRPNINLLQDKIEKGRHFQLSLSYRFIEFLDVGIYGNYQFGKSESKPLQTEFDGWGLPFKEHRGSYELRTEAIIAGITSVLYISRFLKLHEKDNSIIKNMHFGIEINGGIGFSRAIADLRYPTFPEASFYEYFKSNNFHGQLGLKIEQDFTKHPVISSLGLRFGYQILKTGVLEDRLGRDWIIGSNQTPINLDFSGFYLGTFLIIGK